MTEATLYADFQNLDDHNRIRLNTRGTQEDLAKSGLVLGDGLAVTLYTDDATTDGEPDDLFVDGQVEFNSDECIWVARVDWTRIRHKADETRHCPSSIHSSIGVENGLLTPAKPFSK